MHPFWIISHLLLWGFALLLGFVLLGTVRILATARQCRSHGGAAGMRRIGGLKIGTAAPDFALESDAGTKVALHDLLGRKVLLAFLNSSATCPGCEKIVKPLNRLHEEGDLQVLAVKEQAPKAVRRWARAKAARFPVLAGDQELYDHYQVERVPLCYLINEQGLITAKVLGADESRLRFLVSRTSRAEVKGKVNAPAAAIGRTDVSFPISVSSEGGHHDRANGQAS